MLCPPCCIMMLCPGLTYCNPDNFKITWATAANAPGLLLPRLGQCCQQQNCQRQNFGQQTQPGTKLSFPFLKPGSRQGHLASHCHSSGDSVWATAANATSTRPSHLLPKPGSEQGCLTSRLGNLSRPQQQACQSLPSAP